MLDSPYVRRVAVTWQFTPQMLPEVAAARYPALRAFSAQAEALPEFIAVPHDAGTYRDSGLAASP